MDNRFKGILPRTYTILLIILNNIDLIVIYFDIYDCENC